MGKLVGQIALTAALVGVSIYTGGLATGFGATSLAGLGAGAATAFGAISAITLSLAISTGLAAASNLLGIGPSLPKPDTTSTAIKSSRPPRVSSYGIGRLYGAYILFETATTGTAVDAYAIHDGPIDSIVTHYLGDDIVELSGTVVQAGDDGRYKNGNVNIYTTLGATPGTANFSALQTLLPGIWTDDHRGDGVVVGAVTWKPVKSKDYLAVYPNQQPPLSIVAQWQRCPDPRSDDPLDQSSWTWTENVIRHLLHYKLVREGVDYATKIQPALEYWKRAADVCDQAIPLKAGGTEPRYRSNISHKHTDANGSVIGAMLQACDGWMAPRGDGALVVYAGEYALSDVSIGPDDIIGYDWNGVGVDDDKAVNEIVCSYISAEHDYNSVDTDPWTDEDDIAERGQVLSQSLDPSVPSWGQVRRLAKRKMARTNALYRGTVTTGPSGRKIRGHRYIWLDIIEAGTTFYSGPAEITAATRNMATGGMTFSWVSADPNIDAWNPATEEGNPAAIGDRVAAEPLETPTIVSADPVFFDGGAQVQIEASGLDRADVSWFTRWKISTDSAWVEADATDTDPGPAVALVTGFVPLNQMIDVAVSYSVGDGRVSDWSATETVDTTAPPP